MITTIVIPILTEVQVLLPFNIPITEEQNNYTNRKKGLQKNRILKELRNPKANDSEISKIGNTKDLTRKTEGT